MPTIDINVGDALVWELLDTIEPSDELATAEAAIISLKNLEQAGWPMGLERHLYEQALFEVSAESYIAKLFASYQIVHAVAVKPRQLGDRPCSELAAYMASQQMSAGLNFANLQAICSLLGGRNRFRTYPHQTSRFRSGHRARFLRPQFVNGELEQLLRDLHGAKDNLHPVLQALGIYLKFLLIHPFSDGNGRVARLLLQLVLTRRLGINPALLPLGPFIEARKPRFLFGYLEWEIGMRPKELLSSFCLAIEETAFAVSTIVSRAPSDD